MKKLNLGCGEKPFPGYVNVDYYSKKADVTHNLDKIPYPFKANQFDYVFMSHVLEHLKDPMAVIQEVRRIVKKGGIFDIRLPHSTWGSAFTPTHKTYWTMHCFPRPGRHDSQLIQMYEGWEVTKLKLSFAFIKRSEKSLMKRFFLKVLSIIYWPAQIFFNWFPTLYEQTFLRYFFPAREILVVMKKVS